MNDPVVAAVLRTLIYADLFDYALTPEEVFRFLIGVSATRANVDAALNDHSRLNGSVSREAGYLTLPQRDLLISARLRLHASAQRQFPRVRFWARVLAHFPFVRMIALTGGLAMENARDNDIDYFIVTAPGRLWFVRGLAVAFVRLARIFGDQLCPNYLLTENAFALNDQNIYTAHEIVQMIPLYGFEIFCRMRALNAWTETFLPNANDIHLLEIEKPLNRLGGWLKRMTERLLSGALGDRIERWEMRRKIAKLSAQIPQHADAVNFSADACSGFFSGHGNRTLAEFNKRTQELQITNDK
jgi:hypothetical protein